MINVSEAVEKPVQTKNTKAFSWLLVVSLLFVGFSNIIQAQSAQELSFHKKMRQKLDALPIELGFSLETKNGIRLNDRVYHEKNFNLGEVRLQTEASYYSDWWESNGRLDLGFDYVYNEPILDLRELNVDIYPHLWWSAKVGRQALTWGKGDLVFINDLFPKDFVSFFSGRDIQYLKAPTDAIKVSINPSWIQINLIYTPQFDPDRYVTGERISFYDPSINTYRSNRNELPVLLPNDFFKEDEFAWRIQKNIKGIDIAGYGYYGFWKSPTAYLITQEKFSMSPLNVHGASADGSLMGGILALEFGYYASTSDKDGDDPFIRNSEWRWLVNYARDFKNDFSVGLQYYSEITSNYDEFAANHPFPFVPSKVQDMLTLRITKRAKKQRLQMSLFTFYSLANTDFYLRPAISYKLSDNWKIDFGANLFGGKDEVTFWNQFNGNNNAYFGLKYSL